MPRGVAVVLASKSRKADVGSLHMVMSFGKEISRKALPINAGLKIL